MKKDQLFWLELMRAPHILPGHMYDKVEVPEEDKPTTPVTPLFQTSRETPTIKYSTYTESEQPDKIECDPPPEPITEIETEPVIPENRVPQSLTPSEIEEAQNNLNEMWWHVHGNHQPTPPPK